MPRHLHVLLIITALICFIAGCAGPSVDLSRNGDVVLQTEASGFYFKWARVYQQGKNTLIQGCVREKRHGAVFLGHLDAAVFGPKGEVLAEGSAGLSRGAAATAAIPSSVSISPST